MFKTHINNIPGIKAAVAHFGSAYFHGDGNLYSKKEDSDFRKDFSNDANGPHSYRVLFVRGDIIPESLEQLDQLLLASKTREMAQTAPEYSTGVSTFKVDLAEPVITPAVVTPAVADIVTPITVIEPSVEQAATDTLETKSGKGK